MDSKIDYYRKYLKYYIKYQELKKQFGGAKCEICGSEEHDTSECPENEGWEIVQTKQKSPKLEPKTPKPIINISLKEVLQILNSVFSKYKTNIEAGYLYGSRAQGTNRHDSDADVIVFWKKLPSIKMLKGIRDELEMELGVEVDLVSCLYVGKSVEYYDYRDKAFFDGVRAYAKQFTETKSIGTQSGIGYYIENSKKQPKLERP